MPCCDHAMLGSRCVVLCRDEGPEFAVAEGLPLPRKPLDPLGRPADLEYEYDR